MTPPNQFTIGTVEIDRLFPFHLLIDADNGLICNAGPGIARIIGNQSGHTAFAERFEIEQPRLINPDFHALGKSEKPIVLQHNADHLKLRGMFISLGSRYVLFAGSVQVSSSSTLKEHNILLSDFSPADPTPDVLILHKFRELQLSDQQQEIVELDKLVEDRVTYNHHVHTDELTGIANRRLFWNRGEEIIQNIQGESVGIILLLDLVGFKKINDTFGHDAGDKVLEIVAQRCNSVIGENDVAARLGGDEFVILCTCQEVRDIEQLIDKLMSNLKIPIEWGDRQLTVRASMGASFISSKHNIDEAIQRADLAMHHGRKNSRGLVSWFTPSMQDLQAHRKSILACIEQAIEERQITPYFQPIIDLQAGQLHGFEALARWHHPEHGLIFPDLFIEIAEEAGCLHKLDMLILEAALDQVVEWDKANKDFNVHVNLSASSVLPGLERTVAKLLEQRGLAAERLILELTETTVLDFDRLTKQVLVDLAEYGVAIQLDDFGTGYSSLTHLHDLPINGIKIDRSFLFNFPDDNRSIALIETVMDIAMKLGLEVVTEGIETVDQSHWVASLGSRYGQGYLYGKPTPAGECENCVLDWMNEQRAA